MTFNMGVYFPYIPEVLKDDKSFRESLVSLLNDANITVASWMLEGGTVGSFSLIESDGKTYLNASNCQPHSCGHHFNFFVELNSNSNGIVRLTAAYYPSDGEQPKFLNSPSRSEQLNLLDKN